LTGLDPGTYYELQVIASNEMGRSTPQKNPVLFRTLEEGAGVVGEQRDSATSLVGSIITYLLASIMHFAIL